MRSTLLIIGIKANQNSVGRRKLSAEIPYYFIDGYKIVNDHRIEVSDARIKDDDLYDDYFKGGHRHPSVNISAIVGGNGSGKSSVVEYMMRIINNFGASTLGEYSPNQRTYEHLHYIDGLDGSLYYRRDDKILEIRVKNRNVQLIDYSCIGKQDGWHVFEYNGLSAFWDNEVAESATTDRDKTPFERWKSGARKVEEIYQELFYTYISNYSIYAYNTSDFTKESNSVMYERKCRRLGSQNKNFTNDDCNWLHGLFNKNDGYQYPMVLSPYRNNGNIDINVENELSKERLMALLVSSPDGFSILNGHLKVVCFSMEKRQDVFDAAYLKRSRGEERLYTHIDAKGWKKLRNLIPKMWSELYRLELEQYAEQRQHYDYALDYLTYKTLKISAQYHQYNQFHQKHKDVRNRIDETMLKRLVASLSVDHSHITRKIRQILAYIVYGIYEQKGTGKFERNIQEVASGDVRDVMHTEMAKSTSIGAQRFVFSMDDLVPPPIYDTDIKLEEQSITTADYIDFETLSSGEKQQVFTISSILYHLDNIESIFEDGNKERITYTHCNVVLEELELYFHPELQKNLVKYLLDGIRQMHFEKIQAINIIMVTHSPFILSDIQSRNILALSNDGEDKRELCTFGANIHDLLKTSFLHESVIGDYAQWMINRIIICLQVYQNIKDGRWQHKLTKDYWFLRPCLRYDSNKPWRQRLSFDKNEVMEMFPKEYIFQRIMTIDEPIVRTALMDEYQKVFDRLTAQQEIESLTKRISELKLHMKET